MASSGSEGLRLLPHRPTEDCRGPLRVGGKKYDGFLFARVAKAVAEV